MSGLQGFVQAAVVRTNRVLPFSRLNRLPYRLALRSFVRLCRGFPEIRGVYLRHGMSEAGWVPGLSDIDLSVTFAGNLSAREEFGFLRRFWTRVASLRRRFPMLSDIGVLNERHLAAWTRHGIRGLEARRWKVLLGSAPDCDYDESGEVRDVLADSLYRLEFMLAWYFDPPSYLGTKRMQRVASRIFRHAPARVAETGDGALLVARAILELDRWIGETIGVPEPCSESAEHEESWIMHRDTCIVVLPGGLKEKTLHARLLAIRQQPPSAQVRIATPRMLRYWFHEAHPLQYQDWTEERRVLRGTDMVARLGAPDDGACGRNLLHFTSLVLEAPYVERSILQPRAAWFAEEAFRSLVTRGQYLQLYAEKGIVRRRHAETGAAIQHCYPESWRELGEIQQLAMTTGADLQDLHFRAFCLLRKTAAAVQLATTDGIVPERAE